MAGLAKMREIFLRGRWRRANGATAAAAAEWAGVAQTEPTDGERVARAFAAQSGADGRLSAVRKADAVKLSAIASFGPRLTSNRGYPATGCDGKAAAKRAA